MFEGEKYYVYGIIDPLDYHRVRDKLASVCYVGKGIKERRHAHSKEAARSLAYDVVQMHDSKVGRLTDLLAAGEPIQTIMISSGFIDEAAAYKAEALTMELISRLRHAYGLSPLVNIQAGHGQGAGMALRNASQDEIKHLESRALTHGNGSPYVSPISDKDFLEVDEALRQASSQRVDIGGAADEFEFSRGVILVKGNSDEMPSAMHRPHPDPRPPAAVAMHSHRITCLSMESPKSLSYSRRGWDPDNPWGEDEARERARRYWRISEATVANWISQPSQMPAYLMMATEARNGDTTVRYVWKLDANGIFEYFPEGRYWGLPLGQRMHSHPAVGKCFIQTEFGDTFQVLRGYAGGIRIFSNQGL